MASGLTSEYTIQEGDFLPTFWVNVTHAVAGGDPATDIRYFWTPADQQYFDVYYEQYDLKTDVSTRFEAILCADYIATWDMP